MGRFISGDEFVSDIGGDVRGYNLFAYCFNNPVSASDSSGNWPKWVKDTVKWAAKNVVKPVVKTIQKTLSKFDLTYSTGVNFSGTPSVLIGNGQFGVSVDTKGDVVLQASGDVGVIAGTPGISVTRYQTITNAPSVNNLNGPYYEAGGSIAMPVEGVPFAAGGSVMIIPDETENATYFGLTQNVGAGSPGVEFHIAQGRTWSIEKTKFNLYDVAQSVYNKIMEW